MWVWEWGLKEIKIRMRAVINIRSANMNDAIASSTVQSQQDIRGVKETLSLDRSVIQS